MRMRIYKEGQVKIIDFEGNLTFTKNASAIRIDNCSVEGPDETNVLIKNGVFVGMGKGRFIDRVRNCIRLYKFLK